MVLIPFLPLPMAPGGGAAMAGTPVAQDGGVPVVTKVEAASHSARIEAARSLLLPLAERGPGLAVAVSLDGETVWLEGQGYADLESGREVDPEETLFRIYSVSKALTHLIAARLVQAGVLDLRAPVRRYLPEFPEKSAPIPVATLLRHTSGVRHYRDEAEARSLRHCATVSDALPVFEDDPLVHPPGQQRTYSSWGYVLLSRVLEEAGDRPFDTLLAEEVLEPAGVSGIRIDDPTVEIPQRARFYQVTSGEVRPARPVDNTCKWGAGAYLSSAASLSRLMEAVRSGRLLAEPVFETLVVPSAEVSDWGHRVIEVSGWSEGGMAFSALDLDSGVTVVVLGNGIGPEYGPDLQAAYGRVLRLFAGQPSGSR